MLRSLRFEFEEMRAGGSTWISGTDAAVADPLRNANGCVAGLVEGAGPARGSVPVKSGRLAFVEVCALDKCANA